MKKIFFLFLMLAVSTKVYSIESEEPDYVKNSEIFFQESKSWVAFKDAKNFDKTKNIKIAEELRLSYLKDSASKGDKNDGCSFIERALNDDGIALFKVLDINSDGFDDIIYSGSAQCAEGDSTVIWLGSNSGFNVAKTGLWHGLALKILPGKKPGFSLVAVGCCGDPIDEYFLGSIDSFKRIGIIRTTKTSKQPNNSVIKSVPFTNNKETVLRSSPDFDDKYDESNSDFLNLAVFGNILSKFIAGASGKVVAEYTDKKGTRWSYVVLNKESNMLRHHSPFIVNAGWVDSLVIKQDGK